MLLRTRFLKRTPRRPGRIRVTVVAGEHEGRQETFVYRSLTGDRHTEACRRLVSLLEVAGRLELVDFRDTGSLYRVAASSQVAARD